MGARDETGIQAVMDNEQRPRDQDQSTTIPAEDPLDRSTVEEPEGLDEKDTSWGDYPLDEVLIRNETRTIYEVVRRIKQGKYVMDPDFQRDFIWPEDKQSKLIESVVMRIPLPVFYLAEDDAGKMVVVDGLQRLSTFQRFVNGELNLRLADRAELHGKTFDDLEPKLQTRIEDCNLVFYVIDSKVPERARLDIFERVNGGVPLSRQQMRNSLFMGPATRFLKREARTEAFLRATGRSLNTKSMRDREFVNRFCSFQLLDVELYRGDMDDFLAAGLRCMNELGRIRLVQAVLRVPAQYGQQLPSVRGAGVPQACPWADSARRDQRLPLGRHVHRLFALPSGSCRITSRAPSPSCVSDARGREIQYRNYLRSQRREEGQVPLRHGNRGSSGDSGCSPGLTSSTSSALTC